MRNTRKRRASLLLERLQNGPSFSGMSMGHRMNLTPEERAEDVYLMWSRSWIIDELIDLIPELKKEQKNEALHNSN